MLQLLAFKYTNLKTQHSLDKIYKLLKKSVKLDRERFSD